jgi:hypothetical protein
MDISKHCVTDFVPDDKPLLDGLLAVRSPNGDVHERAMPGDHTKHGWWKNMVGRYAMAAKFATRDDRIVDACTGYGWGAWLLHTMTGAPVRAIDNDEQAIAYANVSWPGPTYYVADCLQWMPSCDLVCAMETMEHLEDEQAVMLIEMIKRTGCKTAVLSSIFPEVSRPAPPTSPSHKRLFSRDEIRTMFGDDWDVWFTIDSFVAVAVRKMI